jgi:hypothetical protein
LPEDAGIALEAAALAMFVKLFGRRTKFVRLARLDIVKLFMGLGDDY